MPRVALGLVLTIGVMIGPGCSRHRVTYRAPDYSGRAPASGPVRPSGTTPATELAGHGTVADPFLLCHGEGGPTRTDYSFVASWHCADGSMPLGGDPTHGAAARVGNVGEGPDGHIVDLYRIPCPSGAVDIYVDAYHCGAGVTTDIDVSNLTAHQLANVASSIRELHRDPSSARATELRRFLLQWVIETRQITVVFCGGVGGLLPDDPPRPYMSELGLSLAASVIEDGHDPADTIGTYVAAFTGLALYYQAALAEDPSIRDARMDLLVAMVATRSLRTELETRLAGCDASGMGVHFVRR